MRLVFFEGPGAGRGIRPGVLTDAGVVDVSSATAELVAHSSQHLMEQIIDGFDALHPAFERLATSALPVPLDIVRLRPPLPRPGKILCCIGNYWEHAQREPRPLNMFLKNPDAVIGPGDTIVLPEFTDPYVFQHEAELGIVMTLYTGNIIACGTNHEGLGPLQDGEFCEIEVEKIGRMGVRVRDPLKRQWERSVYLGPGSTNQEAVRREQGGAR